MNTLKLSSAILITLFTIGCSQTKQAEEEKFDLFTELVLPEEGGIYRGHNIGDESSAVIMKEREKAIFSSDSLVQYQFVYIHHDDTLDVDLYYAFDDFGLFEIQTDVYSNDKEQSQKWRDQLSSSFNGLYGDSESLGATQRWTTPSPSNNIVEISLGIEKSEDGTSFISLNLLEPLENEL